MVKTHEFSIVSVQSLTEAITEIDSQLIIEGDKTTILNAIIQSMERDQGACAIILAAAIGYSVLNNADLPDLYCKEKPKMSYEKINIYRK